MESARGIPRPAHQLLLKLVAPMRICISSDIDLDDILDGVWEMPNEGAGNLCVDQTEHTENKSEEYANKLSK